MRLFKHIEKNYQGRVDFHPESAEDTWSIFQLLEDGDLVQASDDRKTADGIRVRLRLTLSVISVREKATFDPQTGQIRVLGRNTEASEHIKLGQHHTLGIDPGHPVSIYKDKWDTLVHIPRLAEMSETRKATGDVAVVMLEAGSAQILFVGNSLTNVKGKVEVSVPKKRAGAQGHEQGMQRFFEATAQSLLRHVNIADDSVKVLVIASPGFVKDDFFAFLMQTASSGSRSELKPFIDNKNKIILAHSSSGNSRSLPQALADQTVASRLSDTRASGDIAALAKFFEVLGADPSRAQYGWRHVRVAVDRGAVECLLICDSLLRVRDVGARTAYATLVSEAKGLGAKVHLVSSLHATGEQVAQLGGLCSVLRFAIHDMDEAAALIPRSPATASSGLGGGSSSSLLSQIQPAISNEYGSENIQRAAGTSGYETDSDNSVDSEA
jgi:protein pelota